MFGLAGVSRLSGQFHQTDAQTSEMMMDPEIDNPVLWSNEGPGGTGSIIDGGEITSLNDGGTLPTRGPAQGGRAYHDRPAVPIARPVPLDPVGAHAHLPARHRLVRLAARRPGFRRRAAARLHVHRDGLGHARADPLLRVLGPHRVDLARADRAVMRRVVDNAITAGVLPANVRDVVEIQIIPPSLHVRDPLKQAQVDRIAYKHGVLSRQTWSQHLGLDYDQEQKNLSVHGREQI